MSQMTATARPLRSPVGVPLRTPSAAPLRVLPARITSTGNGAFATICLALMTTGLIALLLLNTALAQGSLELAALQRQSTQLGDTAGNLQEEIDHASASGALAHKAGQLGMVRANERAFIDLDSGKVSGTAVPATKQQAFTVVTSPTPVPKPKRAAKTAKPAAPAEATPGAAGAAGATPRATRAGASGAGAATLGASGGATTPKPSTTQTTTQP